MNLDNKEIFPPDVFQKGNSRVYLADNGYYFTLSKNYRIMVKLELRPLKRNERKYFSHKGTIGKIADNHINRDFCVDKPNKKWYTDITEFNLRGEKGCLSSILNGYNGEVVSHNISKLPNLEQINDMLNKAFDGIHLKGLIFHSVWTME